jgi:hypothetical protein
LYFDNFPHGHYGTIRQQIWSLLHFPFHLAIVGVVEGSQQLALARYVIKNAYKVTNTIQQHCQAENLDGQKLYDSLRKLLYYFQLDEKVETQAYYTVVERAIERLGNSTGICSPANATNYNSMAGWPDDFILVDQGISNGIYIGLGMKIPVSKLEDYLPIEVAIKGWSLVYMYYWTSFCVLIACLIIFLLLIRRHKADLFDFTSIIMRSLVLGVGAALIGLIANKERLYDALGSPMLLPICVILLSLILCVDKLSCVWCNWRLKKSGQPYAVETEHEHEHGGHEGHDHGEVHETAKEPLRGLSHHDSPNLEDGRKSAHYSMYSDTTPLTAASTEYHNGQHGYAMEPLMSPPLMSPDPVTPFGPPSQASGPGGYHPVSSGQNFGA